MEKRRENLKQVKVTESNGATYLLNVNEIASMTFPDGKRGYSVCFRKTSKSGQIAKFLLADYEYCKLVFVECVLMEGERKLRKLHEFKKVNEKYVMTFKDLAINTEMPKFEYEQKNN